VTDCRTYGGHGEQMAVFASSANVSGRPLTELIGTDELSLDDWEAMQAHVRQGGKKIIQLRGRSSFQSPAHQSVRMVKAVVEDGGYEWPCGCYVDSPDDGLRHVMMAMETTLDSSGVHWQMPKGSDEEIAALHASYEHLIKLRDEVIEMGILPPTDQWNQVNSNLA